MSANPIVHWEIMGNDADNQRDFYGTVFDWTFRTVEGFEGYHMTADEKLGVGGAVGRGSDEIPNYLTLYVQVDDIDQTLETIEAKGGKTVMPRNEIPGMVTYALFRDPAGNLVGLVEAVTPG